MTEARGATLDWQVSDNSIDPIESRLTQQIALSVCGGEIAPVQVLAGEGKYKSKQLQMRRLKSQSK